CALTWHLVLFMCVRMLCLGMLSLRMCRAHLYAVSLLFFCNVTATTEIYTLSLHDALPISSCRPARKCPAATHILPSPGTGPRKGDRKSTRLNSSHGSISYAVFCLKKKKKIKN